MAYELLHWNLGGRKVGTYAQNVSLHILERKKNGKPFGEKIWLRIDLWIFTVILLPS